MGSANDAILGKPWFTRFQPQIDWRSHAISFPHQRLSSTDKSMDTSSEIDVEITAVDFKRKVKNTEYDEVYRVKICALMLKDDTVYRSITTLLEVFILKCLSRDTSWWTSISTSC